VHVLTPDEVTTWVLRSDPANRVILPPNLKLAILSRGRYTLAADRMGYFLDIARASGATWPDRLTVPLEEIESDFPLTIELFLNRRLTMTPDEIRESIQGYLVVRREKELGDCWAVIFVTKPVKSRKELETKTDLEISQLFRKPRVVTRPRDDPYQYVLVAYVCLPPAVAKLLRPEKPSPAPPRPPAKAPLGGRLKANSEIHLRKGPTTSADSLGVQAGTAARVILYDKAEADGHTWYDVELSDPLRVVPDVGDPVTKATMLPVGTRGWMAADGVDVIVASWALLRNDIADFETGHSQSSLSERITLLRQSLHSSNLPFDLIIGTAKGKTYVDSIPFDGSRWQLGRDYQAFVAPDGRWVDLQHLMVGMDVLSRREKEATFNMQVIGTNYSASTWAGDAGSASADATVHQDASTWERWNPSATRQDVAQYYFTTRASDHDLLGDLDAWEIQHLRDSDKSLDSIDGLLAVYYEVTIPGGSRELTAQRRAALERFLRHHGFTYDPAVDGPNYPTLPNQAKPARSMARLVEQFAQIWLYYRKPAVLLQQDPTKATPGWIPEMTGQYLFWLEMQAIEHGATVQ
jgi:hypothetical protein